VNQKMSERNFEGEPTYESRIHDNEFEDEW